MATDYILPGVTVDDFYTALILAVVWGAINLFIRPILLFLAIPINIATLGFFTLIINGLLFWFMESFIKGFYIDGFFSALLGACLVYLISWAGRKLLIKEE